MAKESYKNLTYTSTLPPFLARLREEYDPNAQPAPTVQNRPLGRKRTLEELADDEPLIVDENGIEICKPESSETTNERTEEEIVAAASSPDKETTGDTTNHALRNVLKKQKKGKAIIVDEETSINDSNDHKTCMKPKTTDNKNEKAQTPDHQPDEIPPSQKSSTKPRVSKKKKIKLSFDD